LSNYHRFRFRQIGVKILLLVVVPVLVISLMSSGLITLRLNSILISMTEERLTLLTELNVSTISEKIDGVENSLAIVAISIAEGFDDKQYSAAGDDYLIEFRDSIAGLLSRSFDSFQGSSGIYFMLAPGYGTVPSQVWLYDDPSTENLSRIFEFPDPKDFDPASPQLDYYYTPIETGIPFWSEVYEDLDLGILLISHTIPVVIDGNIIGVVGIDYAMEEFWKLLNTGSSQISDYAFVLTPEMTVIYHPLMEFGRSPLQEMDDGFRPMYDELQLGKDCGLSHYTFLGEEKILGYQRLENGWILGLTALRDNVLKPASQISKFMLFVTSVALILSLSLSFVLIGIIIRPIQQLQSDIHRSIGDEYHILDLPRLLERNDEIGDLAVEFRKLQVKNRQSLDQLILENLTSARLSAMGDQLSGISHEINGQLGTVNIGLTFFRDSITSFIEEYQNGTLSREFLELFVKDQQEMLDISLRSITQSIRIMNSVKKTSAVQTHLELVDFALKDLVDDVVVGLIHLTKKRKIHFEIDISEDLRLKSYPGYFAQIFDNLIRNSLYHGFGDRESGTIGLTAEITNGELVMNYTDDGVGIPADLYQKVFDRFYTTTRDDGGTGLGLYLIRLILQESLKGRIELIQSHNPGVCFQIMIETGK
jgi:signal transduction histidine kinase